MIQRILVPIDLSGQSGPTVKAAADLAGRYQSTVTLLHVIEAVEHVDFEELKEFYVKLEVKAESVLSSLEENFAELNVPIRREVVYGNRLEQIIDYARTDNSDLIILASHSLDQKSEKPRWGSLSHGIGILAPCSVLLLRDGSFNR